MLTMVDSEYPLTSPPSTDVVLAYSSGGDAANPWTAADITAQPARYVLPTFVQSNPATHTADADTFITWLHSVGCPSGVCTMFDLEGSVTPTYVTGFGAVMHAAGYLVLPYGEAHSLFSNPVLDGYVLSEPGTPTIPSNCVGHQYAFDLDDGAYDLSVLLTTLVLWDRTPAPAPVPYEIGDDVKVVPVPLFTTNADGWFATDVTLPTGATKTDIVGIPCDAGSPYDSPAWYFCSGQPDFQPVQAGLARIVFSGTPNHGFTARVMVSVGS